MIAIGTRTARRAGIAGRPRVRRSLVLRPTLDGLEARSLMAVDLVSTPIQATVNATTGLIPIVTIPAFTAYNATITTTAPGTAQVSWGDGTTSTAIVRVNLVYNDLNYFSMGRYGGPVLDNGVILGAHTYARPGTYPVSVTLTDPAGATSTTSTTATVAGKPRTGFGIVPTATLVTPAAVSTGLVPVATFTDPTSKTLRASAYKAQVVWGDGGQAAGVVRVVPATQGSGTSAATIEVLGTHSFAAAFETAEYNVGMTVTLSRAGAKTSTTTVADVTSASDGNYNDLRTVTTRSQTLARGHSSGLLTVARFQGVLKGATPVVSDYATTIAWGDGTSSAGTTRLTPGVTVYDTSSLVYSTTDYASTISDFALNIVGRHTYPKVGTYSVVTTFPDYYDSTTATSVIRVR